MLHEIKLKEDYIEPVLSGNKNFEVRLNDREYQKGDLVKFKAVSRQGVTYVEPELENATFEITYVHSGLGLQEGYVVFGIERRSNELTHEVNKWIYNQGSYKCPKCGHEIIGLKQDLNYCCKCGAHMEGVDEG